MFEWKRKLRKFTAAASAVLVALQAVPLIPVGAVWNDDYELTGNGAMDMAAIAEAQLDKTDEELSLYEELPQTDFIYQSMIDIRQENAFGNPGKGWAWTADELFSVLLDSGASVVTSAKAGDIIFYSCSECETYVTVGICINSSEFISAHEPLSVQAKTLLGNVKLYIANSYGVDTFPIKSYYHFLPLYGWAHGVGEDHLTYTILRPAYEDNTTLSSISVSSKPTTTTYFVGDTLNTSGLKLKATYSDGSTKTITKGYKVSYDFSSAGTKTVTVTYGGKKTTFNCTVNAITLSSIAVASKPNTLIYEDGAALNTTGLTLTAKYSDGSTKTISSGYKTSYDFSSAGSKKVTVTYGGKTTSFNVTVQDLFKGKGTASDPYQITTAANLKSMADAVNNVSANGCYAYAYYIQTADIDLSSYSNWMPIGCFYPDATSTTANNWAAFRGNYNGSYNKITGLKISNTRNFTGLFGRVTQGTVRNLSVSGSASGVNCVGGIVGEMGYGGKIECCDFTGTLSGKSSVGGIIGKIHAGGVLYSCYANAEVTASNGMAGGIAGYILVGNHANAVDATVEECYFVGSVSGTMKGGISGATTTDTVKTNTITFTNNYYLQTVADGGVNNTETDGCTGLHYQTLKNAPSWLGVNYFKAEPDQNDGYPVFYWQMRAPFNGSGTEEDPYQISTKAELKKMRDLINNPQVNSMFTYAYYIQTADIDLNDEKWIPIGSFYEDDTSLTVSNHAIFRGHYDGNYHRITGLNVNNTRYYSGLFGRVTKATVQNLSVSGSVSGTNCVGGVVGEMGYGGLIQNCDFTGNVSGTTLVGGILGKAHGGGSISSCYANAEVSASGGMAGGIAGYILVGNHANSVDGSIENSYFSGSVKGTLQGGISGATTTDTVKTNTITFKNNYYLNTAADGSAVNGAAQSGCTGLASSKLKNIAADLGSPFVNNFSSTLNDGYPVFEWQLDIEGDVNADGQFTVIDLVMLQKWLLCTQDASLTNWQAGDLCADGRIDAFDLAVMKRKLSAKS